MLEIGIGWDLAKANANGKTITWAIRSEFRWDGFW